MRIVLTTLTIAFIYALTTTIVSALRFSIGGIFYSFVMTFGFILIPLFFCTCLFHFLLNVYRRTKTQPSILSQILTLWFIFNVTIILIKLPDYFRHQGNAGYVPYKSFESFFVTNILEGFVTATLFAFLIPLVDKYYWVKIFRNQTSQ